MIRRSVIGFAGAVALLAVAGCDSDDADSTDTRDGSVQDGGAADSGLDSGGGTGEGGVRPDSGVDSGRPDSGPPSDGGEIDAARDATVPPIDAAPVDAGPVDARTDAAPIVLDAASDASSDAALGDAAADGAVTDAGLPALAARYAFDENSGTTAADTAGSFGTATLLNGASWTAGKQGTALDLAGGTSNQYAALPVNIVDGCEDITIALWMKLGNTASWTRLLDIDGVVDGFLYFTPTQNINNVPHLLFNIFHPPGEGADDQRVSAAYPAGTVLVDVWHHVAFTLSGGTGRLYFDGVQIGSNAMTTTPADLTLGATAHAWIGRSTFPDPYLDASIDDLRISCTAYSAAQIATLAQ